MFLKKWLVCLCLTVILLGTTACANTAPIADGDGQIIGTVNGENVYRYEYDFYFNMYFDEYFTNYYETLKMYQGVDLLDEESARDLLANLEQYSWDSAVQAALIRQMATQDYSVTLEPNYTEQLLLPAYAISIKTNRIYSELYPLIQQEAQAAKQVSEEEARAAYDSDPAAWDSRQAAHIIFTTQGLDEAGKAEAKAKAEDIIDQLNAGADFAELAAQYSEDGAAANGGAMDLYFNINGGGVSDTASSFDPAFAAGAYLPANIGDYSAAPVESSFGYHIIKVLDKKEGFAAAKDYIIGSLQNVSSEDISAYFQQKLADKQEASTIERQLEFKYYTEPTEGEEEAGGEEEATQ